MEQPDPGINEREAAVLGLLYEKPLYGYTIEKIIEERGMRHWTDIGFSSIYYVLKRLESRNFIESSCQQQEDKPSRKVYTITGTGRCILKEKTKLLLSQSKRIASPFDLGLAHLHLLSDAEAVACLKDRVIILQNAIERVKSHQDHHIQNKRPYNIIALSDHALAHLRIEKIWVETFIKEVERHDRPGYDQ
jgi:DNA-binding PadR family transcriptional regulator